MFPLFFGNLGAGEVITIALLVVLPIIMLLRALVRWFDRH